MSVLFVWLTACAGATETTSEPAPSAAAAPPEAAAESQPGTARADDRDHRDDEPAAATAPQPQAEDSARGEANGEGGAGEPGDRASVTEGGQATTHEFECEDAPLPDRLRVSFEPGDSARDLALWYAKTTCEAVEAPRDALARTTHTRTDALVGQGELFSFFDSLLADVGMVAQPNPDGVILKDDGAGEAPRQRVVLAPAERAGDAADDEPADDDDQQEEVSP